MGERIETAIRRWLERRHEDRLLRRYGGIQWCPWCRQCAQSGTLPWGFKAWPDQPMLDVLTCSVCEGTSVWLWGMGMHFMGRLAPPPPEYPDDPAVAAARQPHSPEQRNDD